MSKAHRNSILQINDTVTACDSNTSFLLSPLSSEMYGDNGLAPLSNITSLRNNEGIIGHAVAVEETTTNIIPGGTKNMYPSYGNTHGTYNTNQYNSNTYFSIGTITSVIDNIVTYVPDHGLRTYDVVTPQTSGGGLTAGTNYFIKAISTTQFTIHQYNSSQDGSLGFAVHDSIKNDVRIPINATDFPTMWHGKAHLPNSGLVKEIIPNGFCNNGKSHDCLRLYTNYRTDGVSDYMAYGVAPPITANTSYTISFYYRAVTTASIGRIASFSMHNGVGFGSNSFTLEDKWKRYEAVVSSTATGNASMYWNAGYGVVWDIAEIQCEQKPFATSFTESTRNNGELTYNVNNVAPWTLSFFVKPLVPNNYSTSVNWILSETPYTNDFLMWKRISEDYYRIRVMGLDYTFATGDVSFNKWSFITITTDGVKTDIYLDGIYKGVIAGTKNNTNISFGMAPGNNTGNNLFNKIKIDKIYMNADMIMQIYQSQSNVFLHNNYSAFA